MLDLYKIDSMVDVIHGSIPITGLEREIISTPLYNRMHRVLQNSMVYLTFPCNKTKRFEHGIGTMYLAGEMFFNSVLNTEDDILNSFFAEINSEIERWYAGINSSIYSFISEEALNIDDDTSYIRNYKEKITNSKVILYNKYTPKNINNENFFLYIVVFQAVRISGLLHDVGHLPYSHIMEFALKSLYEELKKLSPESFDNDRYNKFIDTFRAYYEKEDADELHEEIGKKIFSVIKSNIFKSIKIQKDEDGNDIYYDDEYLIMALAFDFAEKILNSSDEENSIYSDLHKIVSGIIDADRIDYCSRDFYSSGIGKGVFDYKKLFNTYSIWKKFSEIENERARYLFCPSTKSLYMVEDLLYRRWKIYLEINYHHRVQKTHELMIQSIKEIAFRYIKNENNEKNEICPNNSIPLGIEAIWDMLNLMVNQRSHRAMQLKLIQLDDSWFDTMAKRQFSILFQHPLSAENNSKPLWCQLDEFVSAQKHYFSIIKQTDDFYEFDRNLFLKLKQNESIDKIKKIIEKVNSTSKKGDETIEKRPTSIDQIISNIISSIDEYEKMMLVYHAFIFNMLNNLLALVNQDTTMFKMLKTELPEYLKKEFGNFVDVIVGTFKLKSGYKPQSLYLVKSSKINGEVIKESKELESMSNINNLIKDERDLFPGFYLYICPKEGSSIDKAKVLEKSAEKVSEIIYKCIENFLEEIENLVTNV